MHRPPAVAWKAGVAQWQRRLLLALGLLGSLVWIGFGMLQGWGARSALLALSLIAGSALALWSLRRTVSGHLRWDGERWHWSASADCAVTEIRCVLDLQRWLLLHLRCEQGPGRWLWLESRAMDPGWMALRRAVVASQASAQHADFNSLR